MNETNTTEFIVGTEEELGFCNRYNSRPIENDEQASAWMHTKVDEVIYMILLPIVVTFGLAGNGAFLFMVTRLSRMRTTVNFFLANLAVTDIVFLSTQSLFLWYVFFLTPVSLRYPFETVGSCFIIYFIGYISYYCSMSIITLVSIERFYAICYPLRHRKMQSKGHMLKSIGVAYLVSIILTVITLLKRMSLVEICLAWPDNGQYDDFPQVFRYCSALGGFQEIIVFTEIMYAVLFYAAAIFNGILYAQIIIALGSRNLVRSDSTAAQTESVRNQVARALVINGIIFFVTQIPMRVNDINEILFALKKPQFLSPNQKDNFLSFAALFLFLNSALNPYVYCFSSSNYRKGFKEAFAFSFKVFNKNKQSLKSISELTDTSKV